MRTSVSLVFIFVMVSHALAFDWGVKRFEGRDYAPLVKVAEFYSLPQEFSVENNHISLYRGFRSLVVTRDLRDVEINGVKYIIPVNLKLVFIWFSCFSKLHPGVAVESFGVCILKGPGSLYDLNRHFLCPLVTRDSP